jgi:hypothetical protein
MTHPAATMGVLQDVSTVAPGSVVVIREEEWLVRATAMTADGLLVTAEGLGKLVRNTQASFYAGLDDMTALGEPAIESKFAPQTSHKQIRKSLAHPFSRCVVRWPMATSRLTLTLSDRSSTTSRTSRACSKVL